MSPPALWRSSRRVRPRIVRVVEKSIGPLTDLPVAGALKTSSMRSFCSE